MSHSPSVRGQPNHHRKDCIRTCCCCSDVHAPYSFATFLRLKYEVALINPAGCDRIADASHKAQPLRIKATGRPGSTIQERIERERHSGHRNSPSCRTHVICRKLAHCNAVYHVKHTEDVLTPGLALASAEPWQERRNWK
eukprot:scaffold26835_cov31-Tisochrysis_lutea.AAC.4